MIFGQRLIGKDFRPTILRFCAFLALGYYQSLPLLLLLICSASHRTNRLSPNVALIRFLYTAAGSFACPFLGISQLLRGATVDRQQGPDCLTL